MVIERPSAQREHDLLKSIEIQFICDGHAIPRNKTVYEIQQIFAKKMESVNTSSSMADHQIRVVTIFSDLISRLDQKG